VPQPAAAGHDENLRPGVAQVLGQQPPVNGAQPSEVVVIPQPGGAYVTASVPPGAPGSEQQPVYPVANGVGSTAGNVAIAAEAGHAVGPEPTGMTRPLVVDQLPYTLLDANALAEKIHSAMPEASTVDGDVIELISNAVEIRLRNMLAHLAVVAEHRLEPLRLNPFYEQVDDPRNQLRFMEEIERVAADRRETLEREALIKLSKSKGKDKDAMDRAKQLQKQDQEARLNREANDAAIAALGGTRLKRTWAESNNPFDHQVASSTSVQTHRPRIKRVTMRDLQFVLSTDPFAPNSQLRHRIAFTSLMSESNAQL
ncbi:NHR1 to TAF family protein, partial [Aphelenchoides avenae]